MRHPLPAAELFKAYDIRGIVDTVLTPTAVRAIGHAIGSEAAVRTEIYEIIAEVYRKDQKLPMLIKDLENEHPSDFQRLKLLGSLYEETGDATKALAT